MRKLPFIILIFICFACKEKTDIYLTQDMAAWYFSQVETFCYKDNGSLWGENLYGPLMLIDRSTRKIISNMPDSAGLLKLSDGVYTGSYPREMLVGNTSVLFGGTLFGMAPIPAQQDTARIKTRAVYGLFQRFQKIKGLEPIEYYTGSMDEKDQRLLLKLEWKALRKAIVQRDDKRKQALRDALIFRGARREQYPQDTGKENKFECYRGLPTFTSAMLCFPDEEQRESYLISTLDFFYNVRFYSRSYGIIHGALYAYLAHSRGFDFKTVRTDTLDLAKLAGKVYGIELPEICRDVAGSLALTNYDLNSIIKEEEERIKSDKERIHRQIEVFTEKPVVFMELESPSFDFEPENIQAIDTLGTIYNSIRISDNWGKLTVDKIGCLVSYDLRTMRITARNFKQVKNHIYGDGWHLILSSDWEVVKQNDNYFITRLMP